MSEVEGAPSQVIEEPSRSGDDDVHAAVQFADLRSQRHSTVECCTSNLWEKPRVVTDIRLDLGGQLAGRGQDQSSQALAVFQ
jgi:hypothetical protein